METRYYTGSDMARVYCEKCNGCGDCCQGMTDTIHLDPLDLVSLENGLGKSFADLMQSGRIALHEEEGMILPHLKMTDGADARCTFLGADGRCTIHPFRPGLCRLFPLGRDYDADSRTFRYFVVESGCDMPGRVKVKISRWLGVPELKKYEAYVSSWHYFCKDVKAQLPGLETESRRSLDLFVLKVFYETPFDRERDFYDQFALRLKEARTVLQPS